jgi:hypothetical protein
MPELKDADGLLVDFPSLNPAIHHWMALGEVHILLSGM